jgi:hypothetical protein
LARWTFETSSRPFDLIGVSSLRSASVDDSSSHVPRDCPGLGLRKTLVQWGISALPRHRSSRWPGCGHLDVAGSPLPFVPVRLNRAHRGAQSWKLEGDARWSCH